MKRFYIIIIPIIVATNCQRDQFPPTASCNSFPILGDTTILFELDAGKSVNSQGFTSGLTFRWNFESDSTWDTGWGSESAIGHRFTIPGTYKVIVEVSDFEGLTDTASIVIESFGRNKNLGILRDPRDGQSYGIAKINDMWWMSENLRYGKIIDVTQSQTNNGITEQYFYIHLMTLDTIFGLYSWRESLNYQLNEQQGICPPGWHIPTMGEWNELLKDLPKYYAISYYGRNGLSGLNLHAGQHFLGDSGPDPSFGSLGAYKGFWASDFKRENNIQIIPGHFYLDQALGISQIGVTLVKSKDPKFDPSTNQFMTLRCIRKE
ncbi:MAG: hypothetical protein D4R64_13265 [Porphyromonadaceae bacterium]|nr:MAG: hypothetical protein D4R64_13265 [Porphyromonadaceae bacterium]